MSTLELCAKKIKYATKNKIKCVTIFCCDLFLSFWFCGTNLGLQRLDAVVGHQEDPEGPQSGESLRAHPRQPVPAQVHQPSPAGDPLRDPGQPPGPAVHQVRGLEAEAAVGTRRGGGGAQRERGGHEQHQRQRRVGNGMHFYFFIKHEDKVSSGLEDRMPGLQDITAELHWWAGRGVLVSDKNLVPTVRVEDGG